MQVLIVDDDMATVDVIRSTVQWGRLGIEKVYTAYNIKSAKEILKENAIEIIISDIEMPQGSGLDLLTWFREENIEGEFLLLTCHESFDYATNAVKLHAAEYLLKPFDVSVMEAALKKIILKIQEIRQLKESSEYGKWAQKSRRQLQLAFWNRALTGHISKSEEDLKKEITSGNLDIDADEDYCIVVSKVTDVEKDKEKFSPDLLLFIMENIHSEILCGNPKNNSVIFHNYKDHYVLATICRCGKEWDLENRCNELNNNFKEMFNAVITCCISKPCKIRELYETFRRNLNLIDANVVYYGSYFNEDQGISEQALPVSLLDTERMEEYLNQKKKMDFLNCLKESINDKAHKRVLNEPVLRQIKQEVLQVVYTYLVKRGIMVSGLFLDGALDELGQKASQSVTDMIRWVNFLIERTFLYEEEVLQKYTIIDKINQYIKEHYQENIGRNEIAAQFYLAPEYLSKMYKKQTEKSLKDYISEYRIERAKLLLDKGERISDVAEAVGFENFTYFSTMFKKYTGISPNQYRKK